LWDTSGFPQSSPLRSAGTQVNSIAIHPTRSLILTGCLDGTAATYDFEKLLTLLPVHQDSVGAVAFSPDGQYMVTAGGNGSVGLWTPDGEQISERRHVHEAFIHSVAISPDGDLVMTGAADGTIRLLDRQGAFLSETVHAHEDSVEAIAFDPLGRFAVTASRDGTLQVRTMEGNALGPPFIGHEGAVWAVAVSADGSTIASGGADGTVRTWVGGAWLDNLRTLCERLRNHPTVRYPATDLSGEFSALCSKRLWTSSLR
jgi:WD40 repeat protein